VIRTTNVLAFAVSTSVLAALAVSEPASACPLGEQARVQAPVLPWSAARGPTYKPLERAPVVPMLAVKSAGGESAALLRVLSRTRLTCGRGKGELIVVVLNGRASATATGFDPLVGSCIEEAIETTRFVRIDDAFAHVQLELR
jgi:hypothetical protein